MGYITYLMLSTEEDNIELFESKNTIPWFWVGLLDRGILYDAEPSWKYYDELVRKEDELELERFTEIMPNPMWFKVSRTKFEANSERMAKYIEQYNPELYTLFSDFVNYIRSKFDHEDNEIMIDVAHLAGMDGAMILLDDIYSDVDRINKKEEHSGYFLLSSNLIATATGYADEDFKTFSSTYKELEKEIHSNKSTRDEQFYPDGRFRWKSLIWFSFILLLCPIFSVILFFMIKEQGVSFSSVVIILSNIGFYWYSIYQIRIQISLLKKKNNEKNNIPKR